MKTLRLTVLLPTLFAFSAHAEGVKFEDLRRSALAQSPEIRILELEADSARWQEIKGLSTYLPQVTLSGRHLFNEKFEELEIEFGGQNFAMPAIQPYTSLGARASLTLFDGLAGWNQYQAAKIQSRAKGLALERAQFQLERELRVKFYQALGAQELAAVADQNIKTLEQHMDDVNSQIRNGVSTRYDALRVDVQLDDARTEKMSAEDNVVLARAKLFEAAGLPDDKQPLEGALPSDWSKVHVENLALHPEARPDRQAQVLAEESSARLASASRGHWYPRLSLFSGIEWYNNVNHSVFADDRRFKNSYDVGLSLSWSLFDGGAAIASDRIAANTRREASEKLRMLDQQMPLDFEFWKRRLLYSIAAYRAKSSAIHKAEESIRLAKSGVRAGIRTNTEVLDAELELNQSRARAVKAQVEAVEALANLELALGTEIR